MFNVTKQKLLKQKKIISYLRYAIGEIILIVIGILIAVSLNNWNQEKQNTKVRNGIFTTIMNDLKSDTFEVKQLIKYYKQNKSKFLRVMNDSLSTERNASVGIMTSQRLLSLNKRGFSQLSEYRNSNTKKNDSLTFKITDFYSVYSKRIEEINELIHNDIIEIIKHWRDNYPWFRNVIRIRKTNTEAEEYLAESEEYKNKVTYRYIMIYENYVPALESFLKQSKIILKEIDSRLDEGEKNEG